MSAAPLPDLARLDDLRRNLDRAACDHPYLDAVLIYRPDLRREELEREALKLYVKQADPESENYNTELVEQSKSTHEAMRCAVAWESWVPPESRRIECIGGQKCWTRILSAEEYPEACLPATSDVWECTLFQIANEYSITATRLFSMFGSDAARLLLPPTNATGTPLLSRWLIHLGDRAEPIVANTARWFLRLPTRHGIEQGFVSARWVPATPLNGPTCWWAVRLQNVFFLSRVAVEQAIDRAASAVPIATKQVCREAPTAAPAIPPEDTIPFTSPLSAADLARLLRERGLAKATDNAVDAYLRRYRVTYTDCFIPIENDDRRRNTPKYLYRPEVWPQLVRHFALDV